jgi:extradiol dioxygenase family protein
MAVSLNHTIVHARDPDAAACFLAEMLGLPAPRRLAHFTVVQVGETSLDFLASDGNVASRHFAFLMTEPEFDAVLARLQSHGLPYWADPFRREAGQINRWDDGRGV